MQITQTGKVTIQEDDVKVEFFTFEGSGDYSTASEAALRWAISVLEGKLPKTEAAA